MCNGETWQEALRCFSDAQRGTPSDFEVVSLVVTVLAIVVPVALTLALWRSDREKLIAEAERKRRGALYVAYGQMLAELIDRENDPKPPSDSQLVKLIVGVSEHASADDAEIVAWLIRRSRIVIRLVKYEDTERGVSAHVEAATESAVRALETLGQWRDTPSSVDFSRLDTDVDALSDGGGPNSSG